MCRIVAPSILVVTSTRRPTIGAISFFNRNLTCPARWRHSGDETSITLAEAISGE